MLQHNYSLVITPHYIEGEPRETITLHNIQGHSQLFVKESQSQNFGPFYSKALPSSKHLECIFFIMSKIWEGEKQMFMEIFCDGT